MGREGGKESIEWDLLGDGWKGILGCDKGLLRLDRVF